MVHQTSVSDDARNFELVLTCEHASHALPPDLEDLGVSADALCSHASWDPGALELTRALAARFEVHPFVGSYSRLVVDLNRGATSPDVIPANSFGLPVPGNQHLGDDERQQRIRAYHQPYRRAVERAVRAIVDGGRRCLLVSIHSFTPVLGDSVRRHPAGVLFDSSLPLEGAIATAMLQSLRDRDVDAHPNYPYTGTGSGVYSELRRAFPAGSYAGIEFETRLDELSDSRQVLRWVDLYTSALSAGLQVLREH
ncbi:MAG: N-formylglutamate amidohydrolase [Pseudomonadota bacterium]